MDVPGIKMDRTEARFLYRKYREHQHYSTPMDEEIRRTYQLIGQGRVVVKALEAVAKAGVYVGGANGGLPRLAIARADTPECFAALRTDGSALFSCRGGWDMHKAAFGLKFDFPAGTFPPRAQKRGGGWDGDLKAQVPPVPLHLRPKRGLANYHILWEAEWTRVPPVDPLLLRRIGKSDMWLVLAAWDLTEVERNVLAARMSA